VRSSDIVQSLVTKMLTYPHVPHAGSWVVRIDPLCFLVGCRRTQINQVLSVLYLSTFFIVLFFNRAPFYILLVFVGMCSVFWLF